MLRNPVLKRVGSGNGKYYPTINLQRRNPLNKQKISPQLCKFCEEKQPDSIGHKKYWNVVNKLHGHCSYDHATENFKPYLIELVTDVFHGRLK